MASEREETARMQMAHKERMMHIMLQMLDKGQEPKRASQVFADELRESREFILSLGDP